MSSPTSSAGTTRSRGPSPPGVPSDERCLHRARRSGRRRRAVARRGGRRTPDPRRPAVDRDDPRLALHRSARLRPVDRGARLRRGARVPGRRLRHLCGARGGEALRARRRRARRSRVGHLLRGGDARAGPPLGDVAVACAVARVRRRGRRPPEHRAVRTRCSRRSRSRLRARCGCSAHRSTEDVVPTIRAAAATSGCDSAHGGGRAGMLEPATASTRDGGVRRARLAGAHRPRDADSPSTSPHGVRRQDVLRSPPSGTTSGRASPVAADLVATANDDAAVDLRLGRGGRDEGAGRGPRRARGAARHRNRGASANGP